MGHLHCMGSIKDDKTYMTEEDEYIDYILGHGMSLSTERGRGIVEMSGRATEDESEGRWRNQRRQREEYA